jgi:hypothetical protein
MCNQSRICSHTLHTNDFVCSCIRAFVCVCILRVAYPHINTHTGMWRCYDCPALSRTVSQRASNVNQCQCLPGSYTKSFFDPYVKQIWSSNGWSTANGSTVAPSTPAIAEPWPVRLRQVGANCTECPPGAFCHGRHLPPVAKSGYWTDWRSDNKEFWDDVVSPKFYPCDARNVREVCLGYPLLDIQERSEASSMPDAPLSWPCYLRACLFANIRAAIVPAPFFHGKKTFCMGRFSTLALCLHSKVVS